MPSHFCLSSIITQKQAQQWPGWRDSISPTKTVSGAASFGGWWCRASAGATLQLSAVSCPTCSARGSHCCHCTQRPFPWCWLLPAHSPLIASNSHYSIFIILWFVSIDFSLFFFFFVLMQCSSCRKKIKIQNYTLYSQETKATISNRESHPMSPFRSHSRFELVFFKTAIFIQFCACMCKLCLHTKINEPDNIIASPEVLHDAMFPWQNRSKAPRASRGSVRWNMCAYGWMASMSAWHLFYAKSAVRAAQHWVFLHVFFSLKTYFIYPLPQNLFLEANALPTALIGMGISKRLENKSGTPTNEECFPERYDIS